MTAIDTAGFAAAWAAALHGPDPDPREDVATTERLLARLVERLATALTADPFVPGAGRGIGAELFGVHTPRLPGAEPLGTSVAVLAGLPDALGIAPDVAARRLPALLGALVTGYTAALRACTLEELEEHGDGAHSGARSGANGHRTTRAGRAQQALREEQARYRAVLSGIEVPVALCAPDGRFVDANPAFVELLKHRLQYLRTQRLYDVVCPEDAPMLARVVQRDLVHERHRRVRTEVKFRRRSGSLIVVPLTLSLTRDDRGAPGHLVAAVNLRRSDGSLVTTTTNPRGITIPTLDLVADGVRPAADTDAT
jgi:PAS domain S-box-containing protein